MGYLYGYPKPPHIKEIKGALKELADEGKLETIKDYYVRKGRSAITETRKNRKFIAEKLWNRVKLYTQHMRKVPFVRMVAVCNNLCYDNTSPDSDIDLLIVIKAGRMWTARLALSLLLHFFGVRRHGDKVAGRFCLSFFVTEKHLSMEGLQIKPEDPYLAYWTKLLAPVYGKKTYERFKAENSPWLIDRYGLKFNEEVLRHLPSYDWESPFKRFMEWLLGGYLGNLAEALVKKTFKRRTLRKMKRLGPEASVIVSDDMLKFHNHDKRREYWERWKEKIKK